MMIDIIENEKLEKLLRDYFDELSRRGHVAGGTIKKLLMVLFIADFARAVYPLLSIGDCGTISDALICIFGSGDCLLRYNIDKDARLVYGSGFWAFDLSRIKESALNEL